MPWIISNSRMRWRVTVPVGRLDLHRSTYHYRPRKRNDATLAAALRSKVAKRRRWGYRRLLLLLRREGWLGTTTSAFTGSTPSSDDRSVAVAAVDQLRPVDRSPCRLWVSTNGGRWTLCPICWPMVLAFGCSTYWTIFSRRCLAAEVDSSLPGLRVCRVLDRLVWHHGKPETLLVDNGPEFTGKALDEWTYQHAVRIDFIARGKPTKTICRKLQRQAARRVPQRTLVYQPGRCPPEVG